MIFHCLGMAIVMFGDSGNCLDFRSWTRKIRTWGPASCNHWFLIRSFLSNTINFVQNGITSHPKTNEENRLTTKPTAVVNSGLLAVRLWTSTAGHSCSSDINPSQTTPDIWSPGVTSHIHVPRIPGFPWPAWMETHPRLQLKLFDCVPTHMQGSKTSALTWSQLRGSRKSSHTSALLLPPTSRMNGVLICLRKLGSNCWTVGQKAQS